MEAEFLEGCVGVEIGVFLGCLIPFVGGVVVNITARSLDERIAEREKTCVHDRGIGWIAHIGAKEANWEEQKQSHHGKEVYVLI